MFFADGQLLGKGEDAGEGRAGNGLGNQTTSEHFASKLFATKLFRNVSLLLRFESTDLINCLFSVKFKIHESGFLDAIFHFQRTAWRK